MAKVVTVGEILVEVMALDRGDGFRQPLRLQGPFPSGAPAIFIDQVAKMGQACGIVASVGDDDFGYLNVGRLAGDGVDTSAVEVLRGRATGSAFVRYNESGDRVFVFNIKDSASGRLRLSAAALELLGECSYLHISGSSLFSPRVVEAVRTAVSTVRGNGGKVSFDPNARADTVRRPGARRALRWVLEHCDIFLPSGPELALLTEAGDPEEAVAEVLGLGAECVVVKMGAEGCHYYDKGGRSAQPAYPVTEVDPTGAGDCFDAAFVTCRAQGREPTACMSYANAAGALAIGAQGPMEGTSTMAELDRLVAGAR